MRFAGNQWLDTHLVTLYITSSPYNVLLFCHCLECVHGKHHYYCRMGRIEFRMAIHAGVCVCVCVCVQNGTYNYMHCSMVQYSMACFSNGTYWDGLYILILYYLSV